MTDAMTGRLFSPNEMLEAAKTMQLGGREPSSRRDWQEVMNFFAFNIACGLEMECCKLIRTIYDIPLSNGDIETIVRFQQNKKKSKSSAS